MPLLLYRTSLPTPVGEFSLAVDSAGALAAAAFTPPDGLAPLCGPDVCFKDEVSAASLEARAEFAAYFAGSLRCFTCALAPRIGTPTQRKVWATLAAIPYGTTWSYARLAAAAGGSPRSVGSANAANPISLAAPCHRVIGADGSLTGYAGGLERKRWLLAHEGASLV